MLEEGSTSSKGLFLDLVGFLVALSSEYLSSSIL